MSRRLESLVFLLPAAARVVDGDASAPAVVSAASSAVRPGASLADGGFAGRAWVVRGGRSPEGDPGLLAAILAEKAPALIVLDGGDPTLVLDAVLAEVILGITLPVVVLDAARFAMAEAAEMLSLDRGGRLVLSGSRLTGLANVTAGGELGHEPLPAGAANDSFTLTHEDRRRLDGQTGVAAQRAMHLVLRLATLLGVTQLFDVGRVDLRFPLEAADLAVAARLAALGARVSVPTVWHGLTSDGSLADLSRARRTLAALGIHEGASAPRTGADSAPANVVPARLALCMALAGRGFALADGAGFATDSRADAPGRVWA
ncbi:aconitase X [Salinicola avicenniae]|uniref:aconitase X n=1 Tax=Salinicola avicenniae TaxID=2916836 RepID=UPI002072C85C|nr:MULTISPECIES: aconitase X [unclassified Salinicola]